MRYTRRVLLFVYGSLLRGESNHAVIAGARFVGEAVTAARYTLVDLGEYPALVDGGESAVVGELYEVEEGLLAVLDEFEGHPDVYVRMRIELQGGEGEQSGEGGRSGDAAEVEAYFSPAARAAGCARIESGSWRRR